MILREFSPIKKFVKFAAVFALILYLPKTGSNT